MGAPTLQIVTPIKAFSARSRFPFPRSLPTRCGSAAMSGTKRRDDHRVDVDVAMKS